MNFLGTDKGRFFTAIASFFVLTFLGFSNAAWNKSVIVKNELKSPTIENTAIWRSNVKSAKVSDT